MQQVIPEATWVNGNLPTTRGEDCLYLNVYSPALPNATGPLSVMVWIHGGGYTIGAGSQYDATSLATKNVVLVTINYRLDLFGFLSTEDDVMPGNYGMMDQVAALQWVQDNIAAFGGDPKQVTIFGESTGASSASLLMFSPLAKGLFQRAIMQSGVSLSPWALQYPGNEVSPRTTLRLISAAVQCNDRGDSSELLSCLQKVDAGMLLNVSIAVTKALDTGIVMGPRVETTYGFLPDFPESLLARGHVNHVDTIRGFITDEIGRNVPQFMEKPPKPITMEVAHDIISSQLKQFTKRDKEYVLQLLKSRFLIGGTSNDVLQRQSLDAINAFGYVAPIIVELNDLSRVAADKKHYLYQYNHRSSFNISPKWMSALHGEDLLFVFDVQLQSFIDMGYGPADATDVIVSQQVMEMWTNFAKTGNPTFPLPKGGASWSPYSSIMPNYLIVNTTPQQKLWSMPLLDNLYQSILQRLDGGSLPANNVIG